MMCAANCQSRGVALALVTCPKVADPVDQPPLGPPNVTLFHTFVQSAWSMSEPKSFGSGKLRCKEASRFCLPGFQRFRGLVRGEVPIRNCCACVAGVPL